MEHLYKLKLKQFQEQEVSTFLSQYTATKLVPKGFKVIPNLHWFFHLKYLLKLKEAVEINVGNYLAC